jgi:hypothetical protein
MKQIEFTVCGICLPRTICIRKVCYKTKKQPIAANTCISGSIDKVSMPSAASCSIDDICQEGEGGGEGGGEKESSNIEEREGKGTAIRE